MADVITRFKLETTQYDSKLRDEAKRLADFTRQCTLAGSEFDRFAQKNLEAARALGSFTPSATNAKDKVKELVTAYNDAAKAYNTLTKEQQQTDYGKAMAESIGKLNEQLRQAKQELYDVGDAAKKMEGGGGLFGGLGNKMSGAIQVFAGNMMTKAVGAVANLGSELMETAKQSVELAQQGEGVRIAFERLNNPGLLANLKEATHGTVSELELMKAAVKFDDFKLPVEQLGTLLAFAQKKASDTGQSVDYMVDSIVTGLGRKSLMILDNLGLSASQVKERMAETGDMTKAVADIIREEMEKSGGYVETAADRAARATAQAQDKMMELGRAAMPVAEAYNEAWGEIRLGAMELMTTVLVPIANFLKQLRAESNMTAEDVLTKGMTDVTDTVDDNGRLIRKDAISNIPEITVSGTAPKTKRRSGGGGGRKTDPSEKIMSSWLSAMGKSAIGADKLKPEDYIEGPSVWKSFAEDIKKSFEPITDGLDNLNIEGFSESYQKVQKDIDEANKRLAQQKMAFNTAAQAASNFGSALAGIDDPAAQAAGTVIQAIANIALGFSMAAAQASSMGPYGWIAYLGAGIGAMATTISTIHSLTGYAQGGIVDGTSYSGDNIPIMANAGEVVLTKAMQANLVGALENGDGGGYTPSYISGEQIFIALNRYTRRSGKGELLTWR